jgi:putative heme iron utilization protein
MLICPLDFWPDIEDTHYLRYDRDIFFHSLDQSTMADPITPEISDRICKHMNDDHASAVLTYAQVYGKAPTAATAAMSAIDPLGMDLTAQVDGETVGLRIPFDRELTDSEDAHQVLISMIKQARTLSA